MKETFKLVSREHGGKGCDLSFLNKQEAVKIQNFHKSFPMYAPTPLAKLPATAACLGLGEMYVKDESYRFGLNAFKVLGGSYAIGHYLAEKLGKEISEVDYQTLISDEVKQQLGELTFVTATDGNHGRGVAWAARQFGQKAVVYMPKGSAAERLANIQAEGAEASITELNYDDAVRLANRQAEEKGWVMVQDTAWEGYEDIPTWIMQGYGTMAGEAAGQLGEKPTHVFVQAGVGSLAGAVVGYFANLYPDNPPKFVVMEAQIADCLYQGAVAGDGKPRIVGGDLQTIMAGLACGEPNTISWDILRNHVDAFVSCPDWVSAKGMRMLAAPVKGDPAVTSGESGAVGMGLISTLMRDKDYRELKEALGLDQNSRVLMFSTEGDTDPEKYRKIVWGGEYATEES